MGYRDNYYNNGPRGGYGPRNNGWGYPQQGGYGGPQGQPFDRFNNPNFPFEIGQKVLHRATGLELSVISYGREQLECRKPDLNTGWFYPHELEPIPDKK